MTPTLRRLPRPRPCDLCGSEVDFAFVVPDAEMPFPGRNRAWRVCALCYPTIASPTSTPGTPVAGEPTGGGQGDTQ